jgi:hypothetical protein
MITFTYNITSVNVITLNFFFYQMIINHIRHVYKRKLLDCFHFRQKRQVIIYISSNFYQSLVHKNVFIESVSKGRHGKFLFPGNSNLTTSRNQLVIRK